MVKKKRSSISVIATAADAVRRNKSRFPVDFMFHLSNGEVSAVTLKRGHNIKYLPHVFTEHGTVMLANVLKSDTAVRASIQVVRAFVRLRQLTTNQEFIVRQFGVLERKVGKHDAELKTILEILQKLSDLH